MEISNNNKEAKMLSRSEYYKKSVQTIDITA